LLMMDCDVEADGEVGLCYYTAVLITLKSILVVDLLGLDRLTTAYGILSLLEGVGSLAGTPAVGTKLHSPPPPRPTPASLMRGIRSSVASASLCVCLSAL